jgi:poly(3-hydroxybutyrate) depolymerase
MLKQVADPLLGEVTRTYRVHVPLPYHVSNDVPVPLVMDYHGLGGGAEWQEQDSQFIGTVALKKDV